MQGGSCSSAATSRYILLLEKTGLQVTISANLIYILKAAPVHIASAHIYCSAASRRLENASVATLLLDSVFCITIHFIGREK
jgi:hypothetical protein